MDVSSISAEWKLFAVVVSVVFGFVMWYVVCLPALEWYRGRKFSAVFGFSPSGKIFDQQGMQKIVDRILKARAQPLVECYEEQTRLLEKKSPNKGDQERLVKLKEEIKEGKKMFWGPLGLAVKLGFKVKDHVADYTRLAA